MPICKQESVDTPSQKRCKLHLDPANNTLRSVSGCFCWDKTPQRRPTQVWLGESCKEASTVKQLKTEALPKCTHAHSDTVKQHTHAHIYMHTDTRLHTHNPDSGLCSLGVRLEGPAQDSAVCFWLNCFTSLNSAPPSMKCTHSRPSRGAVVRIQHGDV